MTAAVLLRPAAHPPLSLFKMSPPCGCCCVVAAHCIPPHLSKCHLLVAAAAAVLPPAAPRLGPLPPAASRLSTSAVQGQLPTAWQRAPGQRRRPASARCPNTLVRAGTAPSGCLPRQQLPVGCSTGEGLIWEGQHSTITCAAARVTSNRRNSQVSLAVRHKFSQYSATRMQPRLSATV